MKYLKMAMLMVFTLILTACAANSNRAPTENHRETVATKDASIGYITRDLLAVLTQLLPPRVTTVQLSKPHSVFGNELEHGLREIGYGLQRVTADQGPSYLSYTEAFKSTSTSEKTYTYELMIGDIGVKRQYIIVLGVGIYPAGPMYIIGTDMEVEISNDIFVTDGEDNPHINTVKYETVASNRTGGPAIEVITPELVQEIVNSMGSELPSYSALNFQNQKIDNMFATGASNFSSINEGYRIVKKEVVIFSNDSLNLLKKGKNQVSKIATLFNADTDVVRLIGCSNGATKYEGGNEGLALGRSKRVATELIEYGLDSTSILDEGCWAPSPGVKNLPNRGVVIELKRRT